MTTIAPPTTTSSKNLPGVQVVINSYGRSAQYVERAIRSFSQQKFPPAKIHFINQNKTPLLLAPNIQQIAELYIHHRPNQVCSVARNFAMELVADGWIAFADDDAVWAEDYSERLLDLLTKRPDLELIAGPMFDENTGLIYSVRHQLGGNLGSFAGTKLFYGANFLIRVDTLKAVNGYDPRIGPGTTWASSEDADLCWKVVTSRPKSCVLYAPQLRVFHPPMHDSEPIKAARKAYSYGLGRGALCIIWVFERHHYFGMLEFLEMTAVPLAKILFSLLRFDFAQLQIQTATLLGRYCGLWQFLRQRHRI